MCPIVGPLNRHLGSKALPGGLRTVEAVQTHLSSIVLEEKLDTLQFLFGWLNIHGA